MKDLISSIFTIILLVLTIVFVSISINRCSHSLSDEIKKYENVVGEKVILNNDTLLIIDYSFVNSTVTLEDNRAINIKLYETLEKIK